MSRRPRVPAVSAQTYRVEGEFPCALYDGVSDCAGMTDQRNYCHGCMSYICERCDETGIEGSHVPSDHRRN